MINYLTNKLRFVLPLVAILVHLIPWDAKAWTSAQISRVDVTVDLAKEGPSRVFTNVRFTVNGGKFHGFDLGDLPGATIVEEESRVVLDDGRAYMLSFRPLNNGSTRILLANKAHAERGGLNFELVHTIDFMEQGALNWHEGRTRFDWTPLTWNEGLDVMNIRVNIPGSSGDGPPTVDTTVCKNYEIKVDEDYVELTKFRPVRWYPMRAVVDFDRELIPTFEPVKEKEPDEEQDEAALSTVNPQNGRVMPRHIQAIPALTGLLGLIFLLIKAAHVRRVHRAAGLMESFLLLKSTPFSLRILLAALGIALGIWAQYTGSIAAGIPALVAAAALLLIRSSHRSISQKPGGVWREMGDEDIKKYRKLTRAYKRLRRCPIDITAPGGVFSFGLLLAGLTYLVMLTRQEWSHIGWISVIDALVLSIPAWFSNVRAELPIDPTLEGFNTLRKWRKSLSKMVGARNPESRAGFWVREDQHGPIEVRLRVKSPPNGLNGIEVAGEVVKSGGIYRARTAVVLRVEPGTETARRLAGCEHAVEHHLTPDLQEELIVLRNRRGRRLGLTPLRSALALL